MISSLRRFLFEKNFFKQSRSNRSRGRSERAPAGRRLNIESLEQRTLLTAVGLSAIDTVATETGYAVGYVQETPDYAEVQVTRSPSLFSATIGIKLEGAAVAGSDYTLWRGSQVGQEIVYSPISVYPVNVPEPNSSYCTASFPMGMDEAFVILQLRPVNDAVREIAEQATITLSYCQVSGYDMEPLSGSCSVTINDNDDWTVGVSSSDSSAAEAPAGSEDYATVRFTRSGETDVSNQLSIAFETYGDAGTGDYQLYTADGNGGYSSNSLTFSSYTDETTQQLRTSWNVTIPAGSTYLDVQLRPANDRLRELDEDVTFVVIPSNPEYGSGAYLASSGTVTVTIDDNDDWTVGVSSSDSSAAEAPAGSEDYATVRFTRSGETDFTYSLDVAFDTYGDAATNDYYLWVESGPNEYVCLSEYYSYTDETTQEQRIRRNITIPAGSAYVDVQLRPVNDSRRELDEDVTFIVIPSNPAYGYGAYAASSGTATVTIDDNDDWIVSIAATDSEAAEAPSDALNPGVFTISRTNETDYTYPLEVRFKLTGSADYPYAEDYALTGPANSNLSLTGAIDAVTGEQYYIGTLTIPAGYASVDLYVRPRNDQKREETETAIATLQISLYVDPETNLPPYTLGTTQATVTIADNDQWMVAINATTATAAEEDALGVHYGYYSITRSGETDLTYPLRVYLRTSGTANSADYSVYLVNGGSAEAISLTPKVDPNTGEHYYSWSVQIPAGATSVSVEVRPVDDRDAERDETIVTSIQSNEQYLIDSGYGSSTITIEEDTTVTLTVVDSVALEPCVWITAQERRAQYRLDVSTTETNWNNINVQINVSGTATAGNNGSTGDYHLTLNPSGGVSSDVVQVVNGVATVVVPGGQTSLNFYLMPNGDYDFEQDEDVLLAIAQAFSRSTSNQVDCDSDDDVVSILQAPEFDSHADSGTGSIEVINSDYYNLYVNIGSQTPDLYFGSRIDAVIPNEAGPSNPDGRVVHYRFYREGGNPDFLHRSSETNALLEIDTNNGTISLLRPMTDAEILAPPTFVIQAFDANEVLLYDLATVNLVTLTVDLDIDSNNTTPSNSQPDRSAEEDELENHPFATGKILKPNWGDSDGDGVLNCWDGYSGGGANEPAALASSGFYPLVVQVPDTIPVSDIFLNFSYAFANLDPSSSSELGEAPNNQNGTIRIWKKDGFYSRNGNSVAIEGGDLIIASTNSYFQADRIGITDTNRTVTLYVEAVTENAQTTRNLAEQLGLPASTITLNVAISGVGVFSDTVRYVVSDEGSFYYELMTHPELMATYASSAVYQRCDKQEFSLEKQSYAKLQQLGLNDTTCGLLSAGDVGVVSNSSGLNAALYREYITGKYVLAFAGTTLSSFEDWVTNVQQATGSSNVPQYSEAISIATNISSSSSSLNAQNTYITGHSLGGGLASAASIISGFHGYTFNAAGLNPATVNYHNNLQNAGQLITAYHVDHDLVTWLQEGADSISNGLQSVLLDLTGEDEDPILITVPLAVGTSIEIDSQYDTAVFLADSVTMGCFANGRILASLISSLTDIYLRVQCHLMAQVYYGMEELVFGA